MPDLPRVSIGIDSASLDEMRRVLGGLTFRGRSAADVGLQAAVSRTVTTGTALVARRIGAEIKLRIGDIKKAITSKRGSYADPSGSIVVTRKVVPLIAYMTSAQRKKINVRFKTKAAGRTSLGKIKVSTRRRAQGGYQTSEEFGQGKLAKSFLATGPRSHTVGIFERRGHSRGPIRHMHGPTALGALLGAQGEKGAKAIDDIELDLGEVLEKNVLQQIDRFTK